MQDISSIKLGNFEGKFQRLIFLILVDLVLSPSPCKNKGMISAGVAQLVEQGFCNSESDSRDSPSEIDDVDDKRDKKGS